MRKRLLIALAAVLGVVVLVVLGVTIWYMTGGLDRWFAARLKSDMAAMNINVEVGRAHLGLWPGVVEFDDLSVKAGDAPEFARIKELRAKFDISDYWQRRLDLKELVLTDPVITVQFDKEGRTNLDAIKLPETKGETNQQLAYLMAKVEIKNGKLDYADRRYEIDGSVNKFGLTFAPITSNDNVILHSLIASFDESSLTYNGRSLDGVSAKLDAEVRRDAPPGTPVVKVNTLSLDSPAGNASLAGEVKSWEPFVYELDTGVNVNVDTVAAVLDPESGISGNASVTGKLVGNETGYTFSGDLAADRLVAKDFRAAGLRTAGLTVRGTPNGGAPTYELAGASASSVSAAGFDATDLRFAGNVAGKGDEATAKGAATVASASGMGYGASGIRFDGTVETAGGEATATGDATIARVAGPDFNANGIRFSGTASSASGGSASGAVALDTVNVRTTRVGAIRAKVEASGGNIAVDNLTGAVYGGSVSGSARLNPGGGASSVNAEFRGLDLDKALAVASANAPRVQGEASGTVALRWPGMNLQAARGSIRAKVDGSMPSDQGALPLDGDIAVDAVPGGFRIQRAELTSDETRVSATGLVGWDRRANLDVTAESPDASRLTTIVGAVNPQAAKQIADAGVELGGEFRFAGRVTGPVTDPAVEGTVDIGSIALARLEAVPGEVGRKILTPLGAFSARIERSRGDFRLGDGRLRQPDGSEIAFDVTLPSRAGGVQVVNARLDRVTISPLIAAVPALSGTSLFKNLSGGVVTGTVNLRSPSGTASAIQAFLATRGTIDLAVVDASVRGQRIDELRFKADLTDKGIEIPDLRLAAGGGTLSATASLDPGTSEFRADVKVENFDLQLAQALALPPDQKPLALTGRADGTASLAGTTEAISNLSANISGRDVFVNGRPLVSPNLAVDTAGGTATVRASAEVLGERRELAATIGIDKEELPFRAVVELQDTDLVQFARVASDVPEGVAARATGRIEATGELAGAKGVAETISVAGTLSQLSLVVAIDTSARRYELANKGDVVIAATPGVVRFERAAFSGEGTELSIAGDLAFAGNATSNLTLSGDVNLAIASLLTGNVYAGGIATLQASVMGSAEDPAFSGFANLRDVSLRVVDSPLAIYNGAGRVLFKTNRAEIESFTAQSGGGSIRVGGGAILSGLAPQRWRFELAADQIQVSYPQDVRSTVDGEFVLQGNERLQVLSGEVNILRSEYTKDVDLNDLASAGQDGSFGANASSLGGGPASPIRLDLRVEARDSLVIRNNLADAVANASLVITGPVNDPIIDGRVNVTRGTIEFRNGEYQITRGVVRFPGRQGGDVSFDLQAESEIKGYRVTVGFTGTPEKFYPILRSEPSLPQTQVLSLLLTGDLASDDPVTLSAVGQTGIGVASSLLGEAVSRTLEKRTDRLFGINRFRIDPIVTGGSDPTARLTVGRQVNKNLLITYSRNVTSDQEQVIQLEYRVSDRISIVAAREQDGSFAVDFRLKKRF